MVDKNEGAGSGAGADKRDPDPETEFTEQDLLLGRKASKFVDIICIISFVICILVAIFVFMNVPLDTMMPYDGKYNRSGTGVPMPIALIVFPIFIVIFWRTGKKPDAHHMRKGSRIGLYILGPALMAVSVYFQFVFAQGILVEGGYLAG